MKFMLTIGLDPLRVMEKKTRVIEINPVVQTPKMKKQEKC